jgi:hypothetical protein
MKKNICTRLPLKEIPRGFSKAYSKRENPKGILKRPLPSLF